MVTMSARAAVAEGRPFSPLRREFHDPGVALDEVAAMRPSSEAVVLRLRAAGGEPQERRSVAADWLCEPDGSEPVRLPKPDWSGGSDEERSWSRLRRWVEAWERCGNAQWMLRAAVGAGVDARLVAGAAAACLRVAEAAVAGSHWAAAAEVRAAGRAAQRWSSGGETPQAEGVLTSMLAQRLEHVDDMARAATSQRVREALLGARSLGRFVVLARSGGGPSADEAADVAWRVALSAAGGVVGGVTPRDSLHDQSLIVRRSIPTTSVLRALARRAQKP